jgi:hypothetical protein
VTESERFGSRYEVLRTVSEGRRASVLQAIDHVHDRLVALKVYPATDADRDELLAEARLLMNVPPHPCLPTVRGDFFTDDGDRYVMVMNWVDGTDLQQLLDEDGDPGLPLDEVIADLAQVAEALDHLHAQDPPVIHGDVKPANLVRAPNGRVVLVDFDIAGAEGRGPVGTLGYTAPEVAAGAKPTPAADIYGLASTAVALLNGRPPSALESAPTYPGVDPADVGHLSRAMRSALAVDPTRRPRSAGRLVENLRSVGHHDQPTGVVALLATAVANSSRYWDEEPEGMHSAMARLRDVRDEVVETHRGRVVTSMNEGDQSIVVFREPSSAALAALDLHDRVRSEVFPPGVEVQLRAALAVGEAPLVDGVYTGPVVDQVLRLRPTAGRGATVTSEATAELLVGLVEKQVSIISLGRVVTDDLPNGASVFGLTRPGRDGDASLHENLRSASNVPTGAPEAVGSTVPASRTVLDALLDPVTLTALTVAGLAAIFLVVLSPELGMGGLAAVILVLAGIAGFGSFAWRWSTGRSQHRAAVAAERKKHEAETQAKTLEHERSETRRRLRNDFFLLGSDDAADGARTLEGLGDELAALTALLRRLEDRPLLAYSPLIPDLAGEAYHYGVSALSDALEFLQLAEGPKLRDRAAEIEELEGRLARNAYGDERDRSRDEQRLATARHQLASQNEARQRARDLMFEAERCATALAEARIELASVRAGDTQIDADAVVHTLEDSIRRVRYVQDEMRKLGY